VKKIIYNGRFINDGTPVITAGSRGLRYGDGCFETMKVVNGKIVLKGLHFERLFSSLELLGFDLPEQFTPSEIEEKVMSLAKKNGHDAHGRVRLNVFRGEGGLNDPENQLPNFIIETWQLERPVGELNQNGLTIDIYTDARKAPDNFSHLKTNSCLPYVMAAKWAKAQQVNDAILLNSFDRIADTTIANVFVVSGGVIKTPGLGEGCVSGVMRKYLVQACRREGIPVEETEITVEEFQNASEVFLTNAIRGIHWVREAGKSGYRLQVSKLLHEKFIKTLWP
jgi:branched-chain amino acid aminotransferase